MSRGKVLVAMSGGVDSSVAAALLKEQGYDCVGVFMRVGAHLDPSIPQFLDPAARRPSRHGCCSVQDALDARAVAARLDIPFYVLNFQPDFERIIDYFVDEYARGRTPNPCVRCNTDLKFGRLLRYADLLDAEFVATGHYARIVHRAGRPCLARTVNLTKDQSYVLFGIRRADLARCLFPLGDLPDKQEVRRLAADLGLVVHDKPDSQEICFVPDNDYRPLLRTRRPDALRPGNVLDAAGRVLGRHEGVAAYTVGQRRGLRIAAGRPVYVTRLNVLDNTVTLGPRDELLSPGLRAIDINWLVDPAPSPGDWHPASVKIRHMHSPAPGRFRLEIDTRSDRRLAGRQSPREETEQASATLVIHFDRPQLAVTPGQAAVLYDDDGVVLGGGWIAGALEPARDACPATAPCSPSPATGTRE